MTASQGSALTYLSAWVFSGLLMLSASMAAEGELVLADASFVDFAGPIFTYGTGAPSRAQPGACGFALKAGEKCFSVFEMRVARLRRHATDR